MTREPLLIGRPPLLRQTNAQLLLRLLREAGPCSKADLVRASGLSAPTVTNVVAHLAAAGLVEPIGEGDSTGGRPPDILRFRAERGFVAAVEITSVFIRVLLADLDGRDMGSSTTRIARAASAPSAVAALIAREVRALLRRHARSLDHLLAVVVGVPAVVNVKEGVVVSLTPLKNWSDVPFGPLLQRELKCRVLVENDTNLAAQGEHFRGSARGQDNFVFITIGEGVGAGIFIGGRLYRGAQWTAGEIGYLRVPDISRGVPTVRGHGRLEKVLAAEGILKAWRSGSASARSRLRVRRAADVFDLAPAGNALAKRILQQRAVILADVVLDLALILNPGLILLGGEVGNHPRLLEEVKLQLKGSEFAVTQIQLGSLGPSAVLWGAVSTGVKNAILSLIRPA